MRPTELTDYDLSQLEHYLTTNNASSTATYYLWNIASGIVRGEIGDHLVPRNGNWATTIPARRRALRQAIDAAISRLQTIKTDLNLDAK
jgi:hypothetical protein